MIWKGKELNTIRDLMQHGIDKCGTPEEAKEFMELYFAENVNAYQNIGYLAGYYGHEQAQRIYAWFETSHPIFGTHSPSPEEAFNAISSLQLVIRSCSPDHRACTPRDTKGSCTH